MIDAPQLGDFVKARFEHDGGHRIGIVRQIIQRPGKTLVRLCSPQDSFGIVVELIERPGDPAVVAAPKGRLPISGDLVRYEPEEGAGPHSGRVWSVLLLQSGEALVRIGRNDAPLCRVVEFIEGAK